MEWGRGGEKDLTEKGKRLKKGNIIREGMGGKTKVWRDKK